MISDPYTARIQIAGNWRDAWLYKEHVILWSRVGEIFVVPVKRIMANVRALVSPAAALAIEYLIFRNDWKSSEQFRRMLSVAEIREAFSSGIRDSASRLINLPVDVATKLNAEAFPGVLLDAEVYANRVYLGTTEGLFETYFNPNSPFSREPVIHRFQGRVRKVAAKFASVNVAAEEEGLLFAPVLFGEGRWWDEDESERLERIAEFSLSASFSSRNLLNYTDDPIPIFFRGEAVRERLHSRANWEEWRVLSYENATDISGLARLALRTHRKVPLSEVRQESNDKSEFVMALGNLNYRLLVARNSSLFTINLSAFDNHEIEAKAVHEYSLTGTGVDPQSDILATYPIGREFLVELFDEVLLVTSTGVHPFFAGPAARVRTFTNSRRYQDVAAVIEENGVSLVGYYV